MASQSTVHSINQQSAESMNIMDGKEETSKPDSQMLTDRQLASVDQRLYDAGGTIELCRKELYEFRCMLSPLQMRCASYEHAYREERNRNIQSSQAYRALYAQHENALNDLADMASKYRSLQKELDNVQTTALAQQSVVQECERHLAEQASAKPKINEVEAKIAELERENTDMQNALKVATDFIIESERKLNELERSKSATEPPRAEISPTEESASIGKRKRDGEEEIEDASRQHSASKRVSRKRKRFA